MSVNDAYKKWLADFGDDPHIGAELRAIGGDSEAVEDRFYRDLAFGTAGMRGVLGAGPNRMNAYVVRRATKALADYILQTPGGAQRGVAIAYDSRKYSDFFAMQAALTLCESGVKAYLFDSLRPVPVLSFTVRHLRCIAGIVITASHNPPEYNGYKVYWEDGGQMPPEQAGEVQKRIDKLDFVSAKPMDRDKALAKGLLTMIPPEVDDAYVAAVKKLCVNPELAREMGDKLKIVYTPLHGSGNVPVRRVLRELGFTNVFVVPEQEKPDPAFPTVKLPNPEDPAAFTLALKLQAELGADAVFGTDPDCDRVGVAVKDAKGEARILTGNQIGCLLLHYILSQMHHRHELPENGAVVKSIVTTEMARAICKDFGVALFDVLTGFKFIAEEIQKFEEKGDYRFLFGFEESFGYLSGTDVRDKDGVNACMLIAEAAAWYKSRGMTLYDALSALMARYGHYGEKVASFTLTGEEGLREMGRIMAHMRKNPPAEFGGVPVLAVRDYKTGTRIGEGKTEKLTLPESDVLYYELRDKAWVCVRPSGTEPKIKLYAGVVTDGDLQTGYLLERLLTAAKARLEAK